MLIGIDNENYLDAIDNWNKFELTAYMYLEADLIIENQYLERRKEIIGTLLYKNLGKGVTVKLTTLVKEGELSTFITGSN